MAGPTARPAPESGQSRRKSVERLAQTIANDVAGLEQRTVDAMLPALLEVREELRRGLSEWLGRVGGAERFTAQELRRGLVAIEAALAAVGHMRPELQGRILGASNEAADLAVGHLHETLATFGNRFGSSIRPTQVSTAAVIASTKHEIIPRIRTSSARYVEAVRKDMRHQLQMGLAKGETFDQLTNRLRRLGGPRGLVALRGIVGEPGAQVEHIAEGLFTRYRHWAERVVRTEVINAYNVEHVEGVRQLNEDADEDDKLELRWDATPDRRLCPVCRALDGKTAPVGGKFPNGLAHPPAHPNCRCVAVAWHPSWGKSPAVNRALRSIDAEAAAPMPRRPHPRTTFAETFAPKDAKQQTRNFESSLEHITGKPVRLADVTRAFALPPGYRAEIVELESIRDRARIEFALFADGVKKSIGTLERNFARNGNHVTVDHSFFAVDPAHQGKGLAAHVLANSLRRYEKWGVTRATIYAVDVGRYAWASAGFRFDDPGEIVRRFTVWAKAQPMFASAAVRDDVLRAAAPLIREAPWQFAALEVGGVPVGKRFLLDPGTRGWSGHLPIDRRDPAYLHAVSKVRLDAPRRRRSK